MAEPKRWLHDESAPSEIVALLRAAQRPRAAAPTRRIALAGLLATAATQTPRAAWGFAWLKAALYSGAVVVTGAAAMTMVQHRTPDDPTPVEPPALPASLPAPPTPMVPSSALDAIPEVPAARPLHGRVQRRAKAPTDTLAEEESLLEDARRALAQSPAESLRLLRKHQQRFPNGELTAERLFLSTDAAVRLGDASLAHQMADALTARFPTSPYARRAPALLNTLTSSSTAH